MRRLLFAGDSVTDCGRTFFDPDVSAGHLGDGWVRVLAARVGHRHPGAYELINAGVSGDRVADLLARWDRDVVAFQPHVLTVLIGVNDSLLEPHTAPADFERDYRDLIARIPTSVERLVVGEPFVVPVDDRTRELKATATPHLEVVRGLAEEHDAVLLPLAEHFDAAAASSGDPAWWAADGVHPTAAGHGLIAEAWLTAMGEHLRA